MRLLVLSLALVLGSSTAHAQPPAPPIRANQAGYRASAEKVALVVGTTAADTAVVRDQASGREAARVPIGPAVVDELTRDTVRAISFTSIRTPGTFVIEVPGLGASDPIRVAEDVYARPLYVAMRSFYGQRCGTAVDLGQQFPGYRYAACHLEDGRFHASSGRTGTLRSTGGWHDAGDYGKYIVNSGITTGELLWAWEWYPAAFRSLRLDIPESGNATPDVLDEIRWNLEWMLTMQDEDGGAWHKLTSERFGSFVMPDQDDGGPRYVIGTGGAPFKSTCATADLAAVAAIGARVYEPFDAAFAKRSLAAARKAWQWASANPGVLYRNPQGVSTGAYGDGDCSDERLWAAAELFRTTGERAYDDAVRELAPRFAVKADGPPSWPQVAPLGLWTYALAEHAAADRALQARIRTGTIDAARAVLARTAASGWRHSLRLEDLVWGSNAVVANYGVLLLAADRFQPDAAFVEGARDNLHYLLGRNTFGLSWVTGLGVRPFRHPHHRPSGGDTNAEPWPGLLSGGPNRRGGDAALDKVPADPPGKRYVDDQASYAGNENAINWNAALVFLLAGAGQR